MKYELRDKNDPNILYGTLDIGRIKPYTSVKYKGYILRADNCYLIGRGYFIALKTDKKTAGEIITP